MTHGVDIGAEQLRLHLTEMQTEGGGFLDVHVLGPIEVLRLGLLADHHATALFNAAEAALADFFAAAQTDKPVLCFTCGAQLTIPTAVIIVHSQGGHPNAAAICGVICDPCGIDTPSISGKVLQTLRETAFPDIVAIHPSVGRA